MDRYNHLNKYLEEVFGERTLKICIDGGFTCPNRDGKNGIGGCIFCGERGSGENTSNDVDIRQQVINYLNGYKSERANKFIVYFQNFTNTYDSIESLKSKYDASLIDERIVGIDIATRSDCINEDVCKLLASYTNKYKVFVELGFQTSNDLIKKSINQNTTNAEFINAVSLLRKYNIEIIVHLMVGLPNETIDDIKNSVDFVNKLDIQGIKIHSTYIIKNTILELMYNEGKYMPLEIDDYIDVVIYIITHLRKDIIIHRITGDAPKELLVAPLWNAHKKIVLNQVEKILKERNLFQGCLYND